MLSIYNEQDIELLRRETSLQPHRIKLFLRSFFKNAETPQQALEQLPSSARSLFLQKMKFQTLTLEKGQDSTIDAATKLLFKTEDGHWIESVILRPKTGRTSLCISSQIGCACACEFCATGSMGFIRNLTQSEILDQVILARRFLKKENRTLRNIVFMGMGEPLQNMAALTSAIQILSSPQFFYYSPKRIMISTVGIPAAMLQFSSQFPQIRLALSLHSAQQEIREKLIPIAKTQTLEKIQSALKQITKKSPVMIEYLMLAGINDDSEAASALIQYLEGIPAHINLIPYNSIDGNPLKGTPKKEQKIFAEKLKVAGFATTLRYSFGQDISAACGQLAQKIAKKTDKESHIIFFEK